MATSLCQLARAVRPGRCGVPGGIITCAILIALLVALPASVLAAGKGIRTGASRTPYATITSAGPLNSVFLGTDASAQIAHVGDSVYEVYPPGTIPADYGTFLVVDNVLYAADFAGHGGTATGSLGSYTVLTPISQTGVTGSGTSADPYLVTTVVDVGTTGLRVTQTDSYEVGLESYRTDIVVANSGGIARDVLLYRAMDCYLAGSDYSYGMQSGESVGCSANPYNTPPGRIEELVPLTSGSSYYEASYNEVWAWIGTHTAFNDTCQCNSSIDSGAGLSWNLTVPAGGNVAVSHLSVFSPLGSTGTLTATKTADAAVSNAGASNGYTITIANPNSTAATLASITDTLPAGFAYVMGSTTGATTSNPTIIGQVLTWAGPIVVAANSSVSLHFQVTVASTPGTYTNSVTADAGSVAVTGSGPTAPITVQVLLPQSTIPTLGGVGLGLLAALLAGAGALFLWRQRFW